MWAVEVRVSNQSLSYQAGITKQTTVSDSGFLRLKKKKKSVA